MRTTLHSGRKSKNGNYSARHNDRQFNLDKAEHIDQSKISDNWYWHRYKDIDANMTFEQAELKFYTDAFSQHLEEQNARYADKGQYKRCKTIEQYYESKCPEETILQIGKLDSTVDKSTLKSIYIEHVNWMQKTYPQVKVLDAALHVDEQSAPHLHERRVWIAHDKNNNLIVSQEKALAEMGIQRPDMTKAVGRYNNAKQTFTKACREHFQELCREYGIELETEPQEASKTGLAQLEYKRQQEQIRHDELVKTNADISKSISEAQEGLEHTLDHIKDLDIIQNTVNLDIRVLEDIERVQREQADRQQELLLWQTRLEKQERDVREAKRIIKDRDKIIAQAYDDRKMSLDEMLGKGLGQIQAVDLVQKYYPREFNQLVDKANQLERDNHIQRYRDIDRDYER